MTRDTHQGVFENTGVHVRKAIAIVWDGVLGVLLAIRGSFFYFCISMGAVFVFTGAFLTSGEAAGIFGVLGFVLMLYGLGGRAILKLIKF